MTQARPPRRERMPAASAGRLPAAPASLRPRLSREDQKAQRAEQLLEAAWAIFCESGYETLTIDVVAARAGYSRQPVYTLFGDKQNLFFELQRRAIAETVDLLFRGLRPGARLRDSLVRIAKVVADQLNSDKPRYGERLFFVAQTIALSRPDIAEKLQEQARWVIDELTRFIERCSLAPGEVLRSEPRVVAAHLAAQINGLTTVYFQTGERYTAPDELAELFLFIAFGHSS